MRNKSVGFRLISYIMVLANVLFAMPARASWHCVTGETCPQTCGMSTTGGKSTGVRKTNSCVMPCCARGVVAGCPMHMAPSLPAVHISRAVTGCGSTSCILRVPHSRSSFLPTRASVACVVPVMASPALFKTPLASLPTTPYLLAHITRRTLRPPPSRAPPGH